VERKGEWRGERGGGEGRGERGEEVEEKRAKE
jgi:hypothetical protein